MKKYLNKIQFNYITYHQKMHHLHKVLKLIKNHALAQAMCFQKN